MPNIDENLFSSLLEELKKAQQNDEYDLQIETLQKILNIHQRTGNYLGEIETMRTLGNIYQDTKGDLQRADLWRNAAYQQVQKLKAACPFYIKMRIEGDMGRTYIETRDLEKAEYHTKRAIEYAESLTPDELIEMENDQDYYRNLYLTNLCNIYFASNRFSEGIEIAQSVLKWAEENNQDYILALIHLDLAVGYHNQESSTLIEKISYHADKALFYAQKCKNDILIAKSARIKADYTKGFENALPLALEALKISEKVGDLEGQIEINFTLGNTYSRGDTNIEIAHKYYQRTLDLLEEQRKKLGYEEFQLSFFSTKENIYKGLIEFYLRQKNLYKAFEISEKYRSRLLLALVSQEGKESKYSFSAYRNELNPILDNYWMLLKKYFAKNRSNPIALGKRDIFEEVNSDFAEINKIRQEFTVLFQKAEKEFSSLNQELIPIAKVEDIQKYLIENEVLLSYITTSKNLIIFIITSSQVYYKNLDYSSETIEKIVQKISNLLKYIQDSLKNRDIEEKIDSDELKLLSKMEATKEELHKNLKDIYKILISPILNIIDDKNHWVIVPCGFLHKLPWNAMVSEKDKYLIEDRTLSILSSANIGYSLFGEEHCSNILKRDNIALDRSKFLLLGNPDKSLPKASDEIEKIKNILGLSDGIFLEENATKENFLTHCSQASLIHLACHHFFDMSAPLLSFVKLMGRNGSDFLYMFEILELTLKADIVILSGCQSGLSDITTGDEQMGLNWAFLSRGVKSIISTLWKIEDSSASLFFQYFYESLREGCNVATALAEAQRKLMKHPHYSLPYFWAPYILTGQWKLSLKILENNENILDLEKSEKKTLSPPLDEETPLVQELWNNQSGIAMQRLITQKTEKQLKELIISIDLKSIPLNALAAAENKLDKRASLTVFFTKKLFEAEKIELATMLLNKIKEKLIQKLSIGAQFQEGMLSVSEWEMAAKLCTNPQLKNDNIAQNKAIKILKSHLRRDTWKIDVVVKQKLYELATELFNRHFLMDVILLMDAVLLDYPDDLDLELLRVAAYYNKWHNGDITDKSTKKSAKEAIEYFLKKAEANTKYQKDVVELQRLLEKL